VDVSTRIWGELDYCSPVARIGLPCFNRTEGQISAGQWVRIRLTVSAPTWHFTGYLAVSARVANGRETRPRLARFLHVQSGFPSPRNFRPQNHGAVFRAACNQIELKAIPQARLTGKGGSPSRRIVAHWKKFSLAHRYEVRVSKSSRKLNG